MSNYTVQMVLKGSDGQVYSAQLSVGMAARIALGLSRSILGCVAHWLTHA